MSRSKVYIDDDGERDYCDQCGVYLGELSLRERHPVYENFCDECGDEIEYPAWRDAYDAMP